MMLEYIDDFQDMTALYAEKVLKEGELNQLVEIMGVIHESKLADSYPLNLSLRQLNHQHIFVLPFVEDNGFELDDVQVGLQELSMRYKTDSNLKNIITKIGDQYLQPGKYLLHGDYYPGSWMRTPDNLYIIDTEFSFAGFREFDIGVMAAHLIIVSSDESFLNQIINKSSPEVNEQLICQVTGTEIMRRLIGLAQLPMERSVDEKQRLLTLAYQLIMNS